MYLSLIIFEPLTDLSCACSDLRPYLVIILDEVIPIIIVCCRYLYYPEEVSLHNTADKCSDMRADNISAIPFCKISLPVTVVCHSVLQLIAQHNADLVQYLVKFIARFYGRISEFNMLRNLL